MRPIATAIRSVRLWSWLLPAVALLFGSSCGFHLQGRIALPKSLATVELDAVDSQSDFTHGLRAALESSGTMLLEPPGTADSATIRILEDSASEMLLSVNALNVPTSYRLTYAVKFTVSVGGHELISAEEHKLVRDYTFDEATLLAKQHERDVLSAALAAELVDVVMRRLASL
ncbi:MAG TPA: LPS assembly lipoprotein LptE [Steroidobacteraceae bacterium]|nr:LPS assembly lipoprotein LptE [Steroidobacteraceae bacterium]